MGIAGSVRTSSNDDKTSGDIKASGVAGKETTESFKISSDVVYDFTCVSDVCVDFDINNETVGYCVDCRDYLCSRCFTAHARHRTSQTHELKDRKSVPQHRPAAPVKPASGSISFPCENKQTQQKEIAGGNPIGLTEDTTTRNKKNKHNCALSGDNIFVKTECDQVCCTITGSALLPGNKLILADFTNFTIKLVNLQTSKVMAEMRTSSQPWGITSLEEDSVAVTLFKTIAIVKVTDQLMLDRELPVDGDCRAVVHSNGTLIVSYLNPSKIEIMFLDGKTKGKIDNSDSLQWPSYAALGQDKATIYVSDSNGQCVKRFSLDGTVEATYIDERLESPRGIVCVGQQGRLLVCGHGSHNIHLLEPDLRKLMVISQRIIAPVSVSYCQSTGRVYIGIWNFDYIIVNRLSRELGQLLA